MPTPTKGARLGGSASHQRIILANLATQLFEHGRIVTTEAKAKRLRPAGGEADHQGQAGRHPLPPSGADHRQATRVWCTRCSPRSRRRWPTVRAATRRITKVGPRKGDNAPMALIEIVTESVEDEQEGQRQGHDAPAKKALARRAGAGHRLRLRHRSDRGEPGGGTGRATPRSRREHRGRAGAERRHLRGGGRRIRRRLLPGRRAAGGLRHQGQRGLDEVPHHRVAVVRADHRRGLVRQREIR